MKEIKLSEPISHWLRSKGFEIYAEVPYHASTIDLVGIRDDGKMEAIVVELKVSLSKRVIHQAYTGMFLSKCAYAAVATNPREGGLERCRQIGIGVLRVNNDGEVLVLVEPRDGANMGVHPRTAAKLRKYMRALGPGGVGGRASIKGQGPAQYIERAIAEYKKKKPKTTWEEMWEKIPNHYVSAKSMAGAMCTLRKRRMISDDHGTTQTRDKRLMLLARKYASKEFPDEDKARLEIVTTRLRKMIPRVEAADFEVLEQVAQNAKATQERRLGIRLKLGLDN